MLNCLSGMVEYLEFLFLLKFVIFLEFLVLEWLFLVGDCFDRRDIFERFSINDILRFSEEFLFVFLFKGLVIIFVGLWILFVLNFN